MKTCCDCGLCLPFDLFVAKASCKDGYEPRCRKCRSIKYNKSTPELLCKKIYNSQITHSVSRNHPLPTYTLSELIMWILAQPTFVKMYETWVATGYPKDLAPSVDRIDDAIPYVLTNIQLLTWTSNRSKAARSKEDNELLVMHRAVVAYHSDGSLYREYPSLSEALREFGVDTKQSWGITTVCNGIPVKDGRGKLYTPRTYKGFVWKWKT